MTGNLIGEKFDQFVFDQINQRQKLQGKGFAGGASKNRTTDELTLLNNNNAFLKLSSGVNIFQPQAEVTKKEFKQNEEYQEEIVPIVGPTESSLPGISPFISTTPNPNVVTDTKAVTQNEAKLKSINDQIKENNRLQTEGAKKKLKRIGFTNKQIQSLGNGNILAKSAVLFSGLSSLSGNKLKQRSGISTDQNLWNLDSVYGLGGNKFGKSPMPGIVSAEIKCLNRGSIRSATVQIKAYNQFQFDLLELLYMRLGYTMLLEWGHTNYIDNKGKKQTVGPTVTEQFFLKEDKLDQQEILDAISSYRIKYDGNVDGFFGRVTNFNWNFNPDGSYDITLELYTLGDVVESLTVNVPAVVPEQRVNDSKDEKNYKKIGNYTILEKWLDSYIAAYGSNAVTANGKYINLTSINYNEGNYIYKKKEGWDKDNKYYCTFRELLLKIVEHCIPLVVGKTTYPMVNFDLSETLNIVSAQPNQISFDLETCFIKPSIYMPTINIGGTFEKNYIKDYFVLDTESNNDLYYGQLMNCYLNFKFIKQQLKKNIDSSGKLSLYKFLVGICDGINSSLGDVNKIQPIIKNGNKIVFIDQVQPKGNELILKKLIPTIPKKKIYPFELYGYNRDKSNFIYNFSFESKIDSSLATSLAIGSTAGNSSTNIIDGTAFSSWNTGLVDRFNQQIIPASDVVDEEALKKQQEQQTEDELRALWNGDKDGDKGVDATTSNKFDWWWQEDTRNVKIGKYEIKGATFEEFKSDYLQWKEQNPNLQTKEQFEGNLRQTDYSSWLAYALGGTITGGATYSGEDAFYMNITDKNSFSQMKTSFKDYIQKRDEKIFKLTNTSSQRDGFIPLSLNIDFMGLSGIKIYQQLPIVTKYLPSQYSSENSDTLDFIVQTVDHSISEGKWATKISTLSIPPSAITEVNVIDDSIFSFLGVNGPITFKDYVKDTPWSACFISYLAQSTGVSFPLRAAHTQYSQAIRDGGFPWKTYDPREADDEIKKGKNTRYIGKTYLGQTFNDFNDTVYTGFNAENSFKGIKVGDIIVKNRGGNNLNYFSSPYDGYSHGDIVVEITDTEIKCIGGNVGDTVKYSTYTKTTAKHEANFGSLGKREYTTTGAIKNVELDNPDQVFVALRANNEADALKMVAKAKEEYQLWSNNQWKDDNPKAFTTLTKYYDAPKLFYPKNGIPGNETETGTT